MAPILKLVAFFSGTFLFWGTLWGDSSTPIRMPLHAYSITLDPTGVQDSQSLLVARQIHCQLVRVKGGEVALEAASKITYLTSQKIRIELGDKYHFHGGAPVLAKDFVATMKFLGGNRKILRNVFDWIDKITAIDEKTVDIDLNRSIPQFLKFLASPNYAILPVQFIEKAEADKSAWKTPDGCGGYMIDSKNMQANVIKLIPLQGGRPIEFSLMGEKIISEKEAKRFDLIDSPFSEQLGSLKDYRDEGGFDPRQVYIALNISKSPWDKKENRCQLFSNLDLKPILIPYGGLAEAATDFFPRGVIGYSDSQSESSVKKVPFKIRDQVKISFLGGGSVPFQLRATYLDSFKKLFKNVSSDVIESVKDFGFQFLTRNNDALIFALKSNYLDGYEFLTLFADKKNDFFSDGSLRKTLEESQTITDPKQRATIYRKMAKRIKNDCLILPVLTLPRRKVLVRDALETPKLGEVPINEYYLGQVK